MLAPTGLAAVNVQGQTIHSFFGFPPQLITAEIVKKCRRAALFRNLDTIVIDEVSMVRADLMQGIDMALRMTRKQPAKPFGGVQIVAMGDLHQLPPVVREREMIEHFRDTFGGVYFFNAPVFQDAPLGLVELNTVYRQQDDPISSKRSTASAKAVPGAIIWMCSTTASRRSARCRIATTTSC